MSYNRNPNPKQYGKNVRRNRSDGRLKTYKSSDDCRVWNLNKYERHNYISDYIESSYENFQGDSSERGRYVPVPVLVDIIVQSYKDELQKLYSKLEKVQQELDNGEKMKNISSDERHVESDDSDVQKEEAIEEKVIGEDENFYSQDEVADRDKNDSQDMDDEGEFTKGDEHAIVEEGSGMEIKERENGQNHLNMDKQNNLVDRIDSGSQTQNIKETLTEINTDFDKLKNLKDKEIQTLLSMQDSILQGRQNEELGTSYKDKHSNFNETLKRYEEDVEKKEREVKDLLQSIESLVLEEENKKSSKTENGGSKTNNFCSKDHEMRIAALESYSGKQLGKSDDLIAQSKITQMQKLLKEREEEVDALHVKYLKLFEEYDKLKKRLEETEALSECDDFRSQVLDCEQMLSEVEERYQKLQGEYEKLERSQMQESNEVENVKNSANGLMEKLRQSEKEKNFLEEKLEKLNGQLMSRSGNERDFKNEFKYDETKAFNFELQKQYECLKLDLEHAQIQLKHKTSSIDTMNKTLRIMKERLESKDKELVELKESNEELLAEFLLQRKRHTEDDEVKVQILSELEHVLLKCREDKINLEKEYEQSKKEFSAMEDSYQELLQAYEVLQENQTLSKEVTHDQNFSLEGSPLHEKERTLVLKNLYGEKKIQTANEMNQQTLITSVGESKVVSPKKEIAEILLHCKSCTICRKEAECFLGVVDIENRSHHRKEESINGKFSLKQDGSLATAGKKLDLHLEKLVTIIEDGGACPSILIKENPGRISAEIKIQHQPCIECKEGDVCSPHMFDEKDKQGIETQSNGKGQNELSTEMVGENIIYQGEREINEVKENTASTKKPSRNGISEDQVNEVELIDEDDLLKKFVDSIAETAQTVVENRQEQRMLKELSEEHPPKDNKLGNEQEVKNNSKQLRLESGIEMTSDNGESKTSLGQTECESEVMRKDFKQASYNKEKCPGMNNPKQEIKSQTSGSCTRIAMKENKNSHSFDGKIWSFEYRNRINGDVSKCVSPEEEAELVFDEEIVERSINYTNTPLKSIMKEKYVKTENNAEAIVMKTKETIHEKDKGKEQNYIHTNQHGYINTQPNFGNKGSSGYDVHVNLEVRKSDQTEVHLALKEVDELYQHSKCYICKGKLKRVLEDIKFNSLGAEKIRSMKKEADVLLSHKNCQLCREEGSRILELLGEIAYETETPRDDRNLSYHETMLKKYCKRHTSM